MSVIVELREGKGEKMREKIDHRVYQEAALQEKKRRASKAQNPFLAESDEFRLFNRSPPSVRTPCPRRSFASVLISTILKGKGRITRFPFTSFSLLSLPLLSC